MGANIQNQDLMAALGRDQNLRDRGFSATCGPTGGVVIDRWGHVRGVWHFHAAHYYWIPAGYSEPSFRADKLDAAIAYTLSDVAKG